jgi:hypothetical protein
MKSPPDAVYAEVRDTDPDVLNADGLAGHVGRLAVLRAWVDAEQVRATPSPATTGRTGPGGRPGEFAGA